LHLAARTHSKVLLDCLFGLGAKIHIKGASNELYWKQYQKSSQLIREDEWDTTPLELARTQGEECYRVFLQAALEAGVDIDSDGDMFWPAEENLSISNG
jgi:hypothetical protein